MRRDSYLKLIKKLKSPPVTKGGGGKEEDDDDEDGVLKKKTATNSFIRKYSTGFESENDDEERKSIKKVTRKLQKMSDEDLRMFFLPAEDNFACDCLIATIPMVKRLLHERDLLTQQVSDLAKFNYAREPEFVRDRKKLRDTINNVELLKRRIASESMLRILPNIKKVHDVFRGKAGSLEQQSDDIRDTFLTGNFADGQKGYDEFIEQYIRTRKEFHRLRILKDKSDPSHLEVLVPKPIVASSNDSPIPPLRQRKRVSFNR